MGNYEWCSHQDMPGTGCYRGMTSWNFCPICGAPRPAERKKLWEIMQAEFFKNYPSYGQPSFGIGGAQVMAKAALEEVKRCVQSLPNVTFKGDDLEMERNLTEQLKTALLRALEEL